MRNQGNMIASPSDPSSPRSGIILAHETKNPQGRLFHIDQMNSLPQLREIQRASQMLAHTLDIRETKIVALRKDIESGHYSIKDDQVAEKIMKDQLMDLFHF